MNPLRLAAPLLLAPVLTAQFQGPIRGPFSVLPQAVSLRAPQGTPPILVKQTGDTPLPASVYPNSSKWSTHRMFGLHLGPNLPYLDLDAMSTGNDRLYVNTQHGLGHISLGATNGSGNIQWAAIHFSVKAGTSGVPGSTLATRSSAVNGQVGSDLFGYYVAGSVGIPAEIVDKVFLEQGHENMGFATTHDTDGLDLMLPLIAESETVTYGDDQSFDDNFAPVQDRFFFSVTQASATELNNGGVAWGNQPINPGAIYMIEWIPGTTPTNGTWTTPSIFRSYADLHGTQEGMDVDALGVNFADGEFVYFSVKARELPFIDGGQIYVHYTPMGQGPVTTSLKTPNGEDVRVKLGISIDEDADGLCGSDPEAGVFCNMFGVPTDNPRARHEMTLSVARKHRPGTRNLSLVMNASGWPDGVQSAGDLSFYVTMGNSSTLLKTMVRTATDVSVQVEVPLPLPAVSGIHHYWAAFRPTGAGVPGVSHSSSFRY